MQVIQFTILILFIICCVILAILILIQSGKGGSLNIMGGGSSSSAFGSSTVDVITKATWVGAVVFFVLAILSAIAFADTSMKLEHPAENQPTSLPTENAPAAPGQQPSTPVAPAPAPTR